MTAPKARHMRLNQTATAQNMKVGPNSAEGATYDSQGQVRSASPLVTKFKNFIPALKGRNTRISALQALAHLRGALTRGDALRACPWLSYVAPLALLLLLAAAAVVAQTPKPSPAPLEWRPLIGEYASNNEGVIVLERDGKLYAVVKPAGGPTEVPESAFYRDRNGKVTHLKLNGAIYERKPLGPEEGANQLKVKPVRPVKTLLQEALAAQPPNETGDFLPTDLVELRKLDPTIKLDVRYATSNNLFNAVFYSQPRVSATRTRRSSRSRQSQIESARVWIACSRRLPAVVCHQGFLGCDAAGQEDLCRRSFEGITSQSRRGSRSVVI